MLLHVAKSLTGEETARQLIATPSMELSILSNIREIVNNVALCTLAILYPNTTDIGCFSHTPNNVSEHLQTPTLQEFISSWISLFSRSPKTKLEWKTVTSLPVPSYSTTRWWSKWEVIRHVHNSFGDVESLINKADLIPASKSKLQSILRDSIKRLG